MIRRLVRWAASIGIAFVGVSIGAVLVVRVVDPPLTPLMVIRALGGAGMDQRWVRLDAVSPALQRAVIAAEDAGFVHHAGVEWRALQEARRWNARQRGGRRRGGSTITMQCARSAFLWPGRSYLRKALEVYLAFLMERLWDKRRILEVYLNVIEWGDGVYGADAAARRFFGVPAARLGLRQAALLAAVLPSPRRWSPAHPTPYLERRAATIAARAAQVAPPAQQ